MTWSQFKTYANRFIDHFNEHDVMTLAAALAFYTALSLAPLLLVLLSVISFLGFDAQKEFLQQVDALMGPQASEGLKLIVKNTHEHPQLGSLTGLLGIIFLVFSASAVFGQLQSSLNVIWHAENHSKQAGWLIYLRKRLFSMGVVIAMAFLALVSLTVSTALSYFQTPDILIFRTLNWLISLGAFTVIFALVFKYLPDVKISWRHSLWSGLVTSLLFTLGKSLIGLYLGTSAVGSAYGAAGSLLVLLVWVYYSSIIVFIGAELTRLRQPGQPKSDLVSSV